MRLAHEREKGIFFSLTWSWSHVIVIMIIPTTY